MARALLIVLLVAASAGCVAERQGDRAENLRLLGFNPDEFSRTVRPEEDFYAYVNGPWVEQTEIPAQRSSYGAISALYEQTESQVRDIIEQATANSARESGSDAQKIGDLYTSFMAEERAEELGLSPLDEEFARIDALQTHDDVIHHMARALTMGIEVPVKFYIDGNASNPDQNLAYLWQDGLGMPDRDYYLQDNDSLAEIREAYQAHISRMFDLAGWQSAAQAAATIVALEQQLAEKHWTRVQNRDRERIYNNKYTLAEAAALSPGFDWAGFLTAAGFGQPEQFVIAQTDYFEVLGNIVRETAVADWQTYLRFKTLKGFAPFLNDAIVQEDFGFQRRTLRGQQEIRLRWKRGVRLVNQSLGELVGKEYVARHFSLQSKQRVAKLVENLREAFRQSVNELDWMSAETKVAAIAKLDRFSKKIGHPEKWKDYSALQIRPNDLVGNVQRARQWEHFREVDKLSKPVDRSEWGMTPQTVNAYYRPTWNEIVFPAAILQPPFFHPDADDAINYGAVGALIGHEFSHGFDDQGRKFDGDGRLNDWWTAPDAAEYEARSDGLVKQYSAFQPLPDQSINGELTLGENIADLAGLTIAFRAYQLSLHGGPAPKIMEFTGAHRFFIGYAQTLRGKIREAYLRERLIRGPHSPYEYRVNGVVPNMAEFYSAFNVRSPDGMYLPPDERVKIW
jgi:predicted metalloendopeptidase